MASPLKSLDFDQLSDDLGGFGRFQWFTYLLACFSSFIGGVMVVTPIFTSMTNRYRCKIPDCDTENTTYSEKFLNFTTPWSKDLQTWSQCESYVSEDTQNHSCSPRYFNKSWDAPCNKWIYDKELFYRTTVTQFDLTCNKSWMVSLETSSYMVGMLIGSFLIGYFSDKYGRRFGLFLSAVLLSFGAIIGAFSPYYEMLLLMKVFTGAGTTGCFQMSFVAAIEYVGPKYRSSCGIFINAPFAIGECFLGLLAYYIRDWRFLQLTAATPVLVLISFYWLMPESVRWLITQEREEEALEMISKVAKVNGLPMPKYLLEGLTKNENKMKSDKDLGEKSFSNLLKSKIILRRTFVLFYCWFVATMGYYGLSSYASNLSGNVFLNFTAIVLVEVPSYLATMFFIDRMGRKGWNLVVFILAGTACISLPFIPSDQSVLILFMSLMGKFGSSAAFASLCLYTGELYPTEYRASGVGACFMNARLGGILAPFINSLKSVYTPLPAVIFGFPSLIAGCLIIFLPETYGSDLPQTVKESEQFGRDQNLLYLKCCTTSERRNSEIEQIQTEAE